jgi:isoquinoline 1-oxidoreductase subunit beta
MKSSAGLSCAEAATAQVNRREFLITAGLAGGSLLLKCTVHADEVFASNAAEVAKTIPLNAWLKIGTDDSVTIIVSQAEMGQGIRTTLPALLAEEL